MAIPALTKGFFEDFMEGRFRSIPVLQILDCQPLIEGSDRYRLRLSDGDFQYSMCIAKTNLKQRIKDDMLDTSSYPIIRLTEYNSALLHNTLDNKPKVSLVISDYRKVEGKWSKIGSPVSYPHSVGEYPLPLLPASDMEGDSVDGDKQQVNLHSVVEHPLAPPRASNLMGDSGLGDKQQANPQIIREYPPAPPLASRLMGDLAAGDKRQSTGGAGHQRLVMEDMQLEKKNEKQNLTPIGQLNPYVNKWRICGVVVAKEELKTRGGGRGASKVFSFEMVDIAGDPIRVTAWNMEAERFFPQVTLKNTYYLSNCKFKQTEQRYNNTGHSYELTMKLESELDLCTDSNRIREGMMSYRLVKFDKLDENIGSTIDVMGVLEKVGELKDLLVKRTGEMTVKRELVLLDETERSVTLTLWADSAKAFHIRDGEHPVIAFRGVVVKEFLRAVSLGTTGRTAVEFSPECKEAFDMAGWYAANEGSIEVTHVSHAPTSVPLASVDNLWLISVAALGQHGKDEEKGAFFNVLAMVSSVKTDNVLYKGCAEPGCLKKVSENNNRYLCDKCKKTSEKFKYVMMLSVELSDVSGVHWVTVFNDSAEKMVGMDAGSLGSLLENDQNGYLKVLNAMRYKSFLCRIRAKVDMFNDDARMKWSVFDVRQVDMNAYQAVLQVAVDALKLYR